MQILKDISYTELKGVKITFINMPLREMPITGSTDGEANGDVVYTGGTTSMTTGAISLSLASLISTLKVP